ncbi:MAG TPA: transglycosylase domain-containing protein [Solirubrobacteraceae bacterium]|nr:transglycosylase domain-containing protein [Solirubrobacteraceae bacterium]
MSRQARQRRRRHNRAGPTRFLLIGGGILVTALIVGAIAAVGYVSNILDTAPKIGSLRPLLGGGSSQVYAADGTRLGFIQSDQLRTPVTWNQIPANLRNATVAIEDQRFYKNNGVDLTGIFRAAIKDITHGKALQGGSTITMQLVRNAYLGGDQHTIRQKIIEAKLAIEYEEHHNKRSVLTSYLNSVPYGTLGGQTAIGVQAASRIFFDRPASQLNLQQSALLAGLPQAPSQYNPFRDAAEAKRRRNEVLAKMAELHYVSASAASAAEASPLEVKRGYFYSQRKEDFFFEYVHQQLVKRYGAAVVAQGGLKVHTTIDLNMQREARDAIAKVLNQPEDPASAIVTINPANGDIEAMAESQSYEESQYNLASEGHRQPGSTFKAIVLADALTRGVDPNSTYYDSHTLSPGWLTGYPTYEVKTFGGEQNGTINLVQATLKSDNTVYAQLAADLGESTVTEMAHKMGVVSPLRSYAAEALGGLTLGVTPLEMANVYATLADGGWRNSPIAITKVVFPDGHVDNNWGKPHRVKVLSESVTAEETKILKENVESGTAGRSAISCPTAAKTGTTSELVDAWLDGYTPNYSTAVWMGYPTKRVSMTDVHGEPQQGGYLPAEIWHAYMSSVVEGKTCKEFQPAKEPISYQPFYGKFATTGQSRASGEAESEESKSSKSETHAHKPERGGAGAPAAPPSHPVTPHKGPSVQGTGGAGPG